MAIFPRRILQQLLTENSAFITEARTLQHVLALNNESGDTLSAEWEVVVLNALSKAGKVAHEPDLGGATRVDVLFSNSDPEIGSFLADIITVSDLASELENPVEELSE